MVHKQYAEISYCFYDRFVGVGARRVRSLFQAAKKKVSLEVSKTLKFFYLYYLGLGLSFFKMYRH